MSTNDTNSTQYTMQEGPTLTPIAFFGRHFQRKFSTAKDFHTDFHNMARNNSLPIYCATQCMYKYASGNTVINYKDFTCCDDRGEMEKLTTLADAQKYIEKIQEELEQKDSEYNSLKENLEQIEAAKDRVESKNSHLQRKIETYHSSMLLCVQDNRQMRNEYRQQIDYLRDSMNQEIDTQEVLISRVVNSRLGSNIQSIEGNLLQNKLDEQRHLISAGTKTTDYIISKERHIGGHVVTIDELHSECVEICRRVSLDFGFEIELFWEKDDVDTSFYSMHDSVFISELFTHMIPFLKQCIDLSYDPPKMIFSTTKGKMPGTCYVGVDFIISTPGMITEDFEQEYREHFWNMDQMPASWVNLNQDLIDIVRMCAQCSGEVSVECSLFGKTRIKFGRDIFVRPTPDAFHHYLKIREEYPRATKVHYVGTDQQEERTNCVAAMIECVCASFTYVPEQAWMSSICSQTSFVFVAESVTDERVIEMVDELNTSPWKRVTVIAINRKGTPPPLRKGRLIWKNRNLNIEDISKLIG